MPLINGGFGSITSVRVVIGDAAIKAMDNTAPVTLVPPTQTLNYVGSPAVVFVPVRAIAILDDAAGGYTGTPIPMGLVLCWGNDDSVDVATGLWAGLTDVHDAFAGTSPDQLIDFPPSALPVSHLAGNLHDNGLYILWNGVGGPLTGGNAANTLTVTVEYQTFTV